MSKPQIYFYIPPDKFRPNWPTALTDNWVGFGGGANVWSYFTPVALRAHGYAVHITSQIPEEGILLSHSQYLPQRRITNDRTLLICIRADYGRNHLAEMHVVQNPDQEHYKGKDFVERLLLPGPSYYIPYWPQPGLIPRRQERGDRFENVVYMGAQQNLAPELKAEIWHETIGRAGLNFIANMDRPTWHDYSEVDAVLALRPLTKKRNLRKPPSKLINAWLAGVPSILGPDSAFRALRRSEYDFLEVSTPAAALEAVLRLRDDMDLRRKMAENGTQRGQEYSVASIAALWQKFFEEFAIPYYYQWRTRPAFQRRLRRASRDLRAWIKNV
jgi:hypothetical protein